MISVDSSEFAQTLVGKRIVSVETATGRMALSDGTTLVFETEATECCTYLALVALHTTESIIMAVAVDDDEDRDATGYYKAWIHVVTEAGELNIAEAEGDAGNGYYLHGWVLGVEIIPPQVGWMSAKRAEA